MKIIAAIYEPPAMIAKILISLGLSSRHLRCAVVIRKIPDLDELKRVAYTSV